MCGGDDFNEKIKHFKNISDLFWRFELVSNVRQFYSNSFVI